MKGNAVCLFDGLFYAKAIALHAAPFRLLFYLFIYLLRLLPLRKFSGCFFLLNSCLTGFNVVAVVVPVGLLAFLVAAFVAGFVYYKR